MATVFWDAEGILLVDFLRKLSKKIVEKHPGRLHRRVLSHHDNATAFGARYA